MALRPVNFADLITFTRASGATRVNASGVLENVAENVPRIDYDPVTLECKGLLVEERRTNLFTYSSQFDNAAWTKTRVTVVPNATEAPDGTLSACKLIADTTAAQTHHVTQTVQFTAGVTYTRSLFVKAAEKNWVRLDFPSSAFDSNLTAFFDAAAGIVGSVSAGMTVGVESVGNGWYRFWIVATATTTAAGSCTTPIAVSSGSSVWDGDGVSGLYMWGAQIEAGSFPTSYIPSAVTFTGRASVGTYWDANGVLQTAAADVARMSYNPANLSAPPKLLLEEQRTNLLTHSGDALDPSWIRSGGLSVASNAGGFHLADDSTSNYAQLYKEVGAVPLTRYCASVEIEKDEIPRTTRFAGIELQFRGDTNEFFNIRVDTKTGEYSVNGANLSSVTGRVSDAGTHWRVSVSAISQYAGNTSIRCVFMPAFGASESFAQSPAAVGSAVFRRFQLEQGAYATSYIPTTDSQVTRAADISSSSQTTRAADSAVINTLSSWFNASGTGTLIAEATRRSPGTNDSARSFPHIAAFMKGSSIGLGDYIALRLAAPDEVNPCVGNLGVFASASPGLGPLAAGQTAKLALAGNGGDIVAMRDGGSPSAISGRTWGTECDTFWIGSQGGERRFFNGHIRRIEYYPSRLSNSELQALTS